MNAPQQPPTQGDIEQQMKATLEMQREAYLKEGVVSAETRIDRLQRAVDVLIKYNEKIVDALNTDFTCRPREVTLLTDVGAGIAPLKHAIKHVRSWMKPEKRPATFPFNLLGARARIEYQPLGVVGVIAPWNFPVNMVFAPLAGVLAAGNRAMIKPSEFTPATSALMAQMIAEAYDPKEIAIFDGGPEVGQAFSSLPFDHMIFTGATSIARHILAAAARNLVPVTLELGGKSPVVISRSADIEKSIGRIMLGKTLNAGQICLAPDYLLVPEEKLHEIIAAAQKAVGQMYPKDSRQPAVHLRHQRAPLPAPQRLSRRSHRTRTKDHPHQSCRRELQRAKRHDENTAHADPGAGGRPEHDGRGIVRAAAPHSHL